MGSYGIQGPGFWDDEALNGCGPWARIVASYLITGRPATNLPGLIPIGMAGLAEGASVPLGEVERAFAELVRIRFAEYDPSRKLIRVPNGPRFNPPHNGNVVRGWYRQWKGMPRSPLRDRHLDTIKAVLTAVARETDKTWPLEVWAETFGMHSNETATLDGLETVSPSTANQSAVDEISSTVSVSVPVKGSDSGSPDPDLPEERKGTPRARGRGTQPPLGELLVEKRVTPMRQVTDCFQALYVERTGGKKPTWDGKTTTLVQQLLVLHGADEVCRRIEILFRSPPAFLAGSVPDVGTLRAHFDKLAAPANGTRAGPGKRSASDLMRRAMDEREQETGE